jgi:peptidoglycan/LPS O-acetylase OafA/YrhL
LVPVRGLISWRQLAGVRWLTVTPRPRTAENAGGLSRETSLYLDAVRFSAAFVVFLGHFATYAISGGVFWRIAPLRHDAVIVFFVLSGFVIAYAVAKGENNPTDYFVNRAARIYSVAIPAVIITVAIDRVAFYLDPNYCSWGCSPGSSWQQILTSVTFTNQFWSTGMFPGSDGPYWSLGFEVPYYAAFGLALFARGPWRTILPLALLGIAGPTVAALFPLWLLGAALYRFEAENLPEFAGWLLFLGSIVAWSAIAIWAHSTDGWILDFPIAGLWRDRIPADYVTGIAFAINIAGFRVIGFRFVTILRRFQRQIRWFAARTFTLYLLHYPVMRFIATFLPWGNKAAITRVVTLLATMLIVLLVAEFFELRKQPWRQFFAGGISVIRRVITTG